MNFTSVADIISSFRNQKVLIIGDVMVDSYIYGSVQRISPEAPVPILNVKNRDKRLGGAANVALNVQALGAEPILCSIIGDDLGAEDFKSLLKKRGMSSEGIIQSQSRMTTVKNRVISNGHHLIRIDEEVDQPLSDLDRKSLIGHIDKLISSCDVVIFEDYDKGCLDEQVIAHVIARADELGVVSAVDPKKRNFLHYKGATLFKPNLKELREGLNVDVDPSSLASLKEGVDQLRDIINFKNALITLSEHGVYFQNENESKQYPAHLRSISDVSGAGDTVISIAGLCLSLGLPLTFTAELANLGGGIVCEYPGVVPVDVERLLLEAEKNSILGQLFNA
jgi:rfaE bifunctional protein kinase chain/domain